MANNGSGFVWIDSAKGLWYNPDGTVTNKQEKAQKAWAGVAHKLEEYYGLEVQSFNPGFDCVNIHGSEAIYLPAWLAVKMIDVKEETSWFRKFVKGLFSSVVKHTRREQCQEPPGSATKASKKPTEAAPDSTSSSGLIITESPLIDSARATSYARKKDEANFRSTFERG